jgi:hypothetical protein
MADIDFSREDFSVGPIGDIRDGRGRQRQQANGLHLIAPARLPSLAHRECRRSHAETAG